MAKEVFYQPIAWKRVNSFPLEEVGGEPIANARVPFKKEYLQQLSFVTRPDFIPQEGIPQLFQISSLHGRSYEMRFNEKGMILWSDEYSNIFSSFTTKGNNLEGPKALKDPDAPSGFIVHGLQDSDSLLRQQRASNLLRKNHVDTEIILEVLEPSELPMGDETLSLPEIKNRLIMQVWEENLPPAQTEEEAKDKRITRFDLPDLTKALEGMTFYITHRGLQTPERLTDLALADSQEEFINLSEKSFQFFNMTQTILRKKENEPAEWKKIDVMKKEDRMFFFLKVMPSLMGNNYGKMHNLELRHVFPHLGNISLLGGIYDLDSVEGEPLGIGDKPITEEQKLDEVAYILMGNETHQFSKGLIPLLASLVGKGLITETNTFDFRQPLIHFLHSYMSERAWKENEQDDRFEYLTRLLEEGIDRMLSNTNVNI